MARTRKRELEFANFICKFGKHDLLDLAEEVVIPAFFSGEARSWGKSHWFILDPKVIDLGDDEVGLAFRFVKDTKVEREQIIVDGKVREDRRSMKSAPSALALLVLNSHRLMYYPETKSAPTLSELRSTAEALIRLQQRKFIESAIADRSTSEDKATLRADLVEKYPPSTVRIVPLAGETEIAAALKQYAQVRKITVLFEAPNNEIQWGALFEQVADTRSQLDATVTKLEHTNNKGLNHDAAVREVVAATASGNSEVIVTGVGTEGGRLRHETDGFSIRVPAEIDVQDPAHAAPQMTDAFKTLLKSGALKKPRLVASTVQAVKRLLRRFGH